MAKLRGNKQAHSGPYPLGEFPDSILIEIGKRIVHHLAVGKADITGDEFAQIFADSISGNHLGKPLGIADVIWNGCGWSAKTVKSNNPFHQNPIRLISGRNSPDFSFDISDPRADIQKTGAAVLSIWNERINISRRDHDDLRTVVLMRDMAALNFMIFEMPAELFPTTNYIWRENRRKNFQGHDKVDDRHCFTWQPHGAQFTIIEPVPGGAVKFRIKKHPGTLEMQHVLNLSRFRDDWIIRVP